MIQKEELISKIMEMADLSNDEKAEIIGSLRRQKKYGLVWEDHPEDAEERLKSAFPVLREVKELAIQSSPFKGDERGSSPNHILIEGDNLEALMALSYTHEGMVDVIYIDPPYNTGNKDFIYNDCIVDSEDGYRHSKWLSFMEKRLRLAKKLLSDKGVIFISIDDNEQANLKLLCDEVFGASNFIDIFSWVKTETPANLSLKTKKAVEYILCYTKQINSIKFRGLSKNSVSNNGLMNQTNAAHDLVFPINVVDTRLPDGIYSKGHYGTSSYEIELKEDTEVKDGYFVKPVHLFGKFKWGQEYLNQAICNGTKISIKTKAFSPSYEKAEYEPEVPWNLINRTFGVDTNEVASTQLKEILPNSEFSFPKPYTLIKYLINFIDANIILDFFAGSGTTLHATMQLNAEDGGHRQCILVTNNENNICRDVTYERNKRVIQGYTTPKGVAVEGLKDNNLRYYTTEFLPRETSFDAKQALMRAAVDMMCIKENIYTEEREFCGMKFKPSLLRYFKESDGRQMLFVFDERVIEHIVPLMRDMDGQIKVYVFSNGAYAYEDEFLELRDKVELCALPEALLQVYKQVLPQNDEDVRI